MASYSVPCPKISPLLAASSQSITGDSRPRIASFPRSDVRSMHAQLQKGHSRSQLEVFKVCSKLNEVAVEKQSNSIPASETVSVKKSENQLKIPDASSIPVFMSQVSDLIKLVDSRDIVELQLKQMDCELLIRKKEAIPQPETAAPANFSLPPQQLVFPPQQPHANVPAPASVLPSPASPPALPAPAKPKSSHPPFKCPMAGNFYRSPAPSAPPFVKVGDKIQKGQVICIIEAMKLMNEIEADQSGTIVDILVDDGKPVSVDMPLFVIAP